MLKTERKRTAWLLTLLASTALGITPVVFLEAQDSGGQVIGLWHLDEVDAAGY